MLFDKHFFFNIYYTHTYTHIQQYLYISLIPPIFHTYTHTHIHKHFNVLNITHTHTQIFEKITL